MNSRNTFYTINLTLVFILAVAVVRLFILPDDLTVPKTTHAGTTTSPDPTQGLPNSNDSSSSDNYDGIIESSLFANSDSETTTARQASATPAMDLPNLKLKGTVAGPPTIARAIIQDLTDNRVSVCKIGDTIAQATLVSIEKNKATLSLGGRQFTLQQSTGESRSPSPQQPQASQVEKAIPVPLLKPPNKSRSELFDEVMKTTTFEPHIINDQCDGLKIDGLKNTRITGFLGLQNGDIIQTVNGQKFTSKQKAFQILKKARTQARIEIQLMRDQQPKTLTVPLR